MQLIFCQRTGKGYGERVWGKDEGIGIDGDFLFIAHIFLLLIH